MDNKEPLTLPFLITKGLVVFPNMTESIEAGRAYSKEAARRSHDQMNSLLFVGVQKDEKMDDIKIPDDVYLTAALCRIVDYQEKDDTIRIRVIGSKRVALSNLRLDQGTYLADGTLIEDKMGDEGEIVTLIRDIVTTIGNSPSIGQNIPKSAINSLGRGGSPADIADTLSGYLPFSVEQKVDLLAEGNVNERLKAILAAVKQQEQLNQIDEKLDETVRERAEQSQKEYFLREKMRAIKDELGEGKDSADDVDAIRQKSKRIPILKTLKPR